MVFLNILIGMFLASISSIAYGLPPEGLEGYGIYSKESANYHVYLQGENRNSYWKTEGLGTSIISDYLNESGNQWTLGFYQNADTVNSNHLAYFVRYDLIPWETHSLSLKYLHQDWYFIESGQENIGLEFSGYFPFELARSSFYYSIGFYYRWLKQSWNQDAHKPFSFQTEDKSGFPTFTLGFQKELSDDGSFLTFDYNDRDAFNYQNGDSWSTDLSVNISFGEERFLKLYYGVMWGGTFTFLPGFPMSEYFGVGLVL